MQCFLFIAANGNFCLFTILFLSLLNILVYISINPIFHLCQNYSQMGAILICLILSLSNAYVMLTPMSLVESFAWFVGQSEISTHLMPGAAACFDIQHSRDPFTERFMRL